MATLNQFTNTPGPLQGALANLMMSQQQMRAAQQPRHGYGRGLLGLVTGFIANRQRSKAMEAAQGQFQADLQAYQQQQAAYQQQQQQASLERLTAAGFAPEVAQLMVHNPDFKEEMLERQFGEKDEPKASAEERRFDARRAAGMQAGLEGDALEQFVLYGKPAEQKRRLITHSDGSQEWVLVDDRGGPMDDKVLARQQERAAIDRDEARAQLMRFSDRFDEDYFTAPGRMAAWVGKKSDQAGAIGDWIGNLTGTQEQLEKWEQFNADRGAAIGELLEAYNRYRHAITGAQTSQFEIEYLEGAFLDPTLGPKEMKSRLNALVTRLDQQAGEARGALSGDANEAFGRSIIEGVAGAPRQQQGQASQQDVASRATQQASDGRRTIYLVDGAWVDEKGNPV